jgi:fructuronate reductase
MPGRLGLAALPRLDPAYRPRVDPAALRPGIVHLGIGAFHRAHQAVFTEDALAATGERDWAICGVTQRSRDVLDRLAPQDGLYGLLERDQAGVALRVVGTVREVLCAADDPAAVVARIADPATRVVSLTVTEKGYRYDPATGRLRTGDPETAADLAGRPPRTAVGQLARGLAARCAAGAGPVTVLCCDNLTGNGARVRGLVREFAELARAGALLAWLEQAVRFPSTMVDRIVPAATDADRAEVAGLLGMADHGALATEPFRQWVIEDDFAAGRPAWELAGAVLTGDVAPYETVKLRLLNGSHSTLAYLGALAGYDHIAGAVGDDTLRGVAERLMAEDAGPTLAVPPGFDVAAYRASVLTRFANPALRHRTTQVAQDGSQKLPQRLLGTIRDRLAAGALPRWATLGIAAWMRYVWAAADDSGAPLPVEDPLATRLRQLLAAADSPAAVVGALLGLPEIFGQDLPADAGFRRLLTADLDQLTRAGAAATAADQLRAAG